MEALLDGVDLEVLGGCGAASLVVFYGVLVVVGGVRWWWQLLPGVGFWCSWCLWFFGGIGVALCGGGNCLHVIAIVVWLGLTEECHNSKSFGAPLWLLLCCSRVVVLFECGLCKISIDDNAITSAVDVSCNPSGLLRIASVSPDGKLLAVLGHNTEGLIVDAHIGKRLVHENPQNFKVMCNYSCFNHTYDTTKGAFRDFSDRSSYDYKVAGREAIAREYPVIEL
ncbi:hypothetical protein TSUD_151590 [Trifolium subterraneum]|uniref:Uncharacterized protein n=1 Tax=Trifolium subterraneum TaxID=3900 RepID=A0A2Z6N3E0_TRISU|nr:hypothetical protein TSUD_151590 [Trifolium subterraneum]